MQRSLAAPNCGRVNVWRWRDVPTEIAHGAAVKRKLPAVSGGWNNDQLCSVMNASRSSGPSSERGSGRKMNITTQLASNAYMCLYGMVASEVQTSTLSLLPSAVSIPDQYSCIVHESAH
jgi:hypothetical protein